MSRYSNDFRALVAKKLGMVGSVNSVGSAVSLESISKDFEVSVTCLKLWVKKIAAGTLYDIIVKGGRPVVYNLVGLKKFVEDNPDKYLREINDDFFEGKASTSGIDDALKRMGISLKKKSRFLKKETVSKE
jgi:transposase